MSCWGQNECQGKERFSTLGSLSLSIQSPISIGGRSSLPRSLNLSRWQSSTRLVIRDLTRRMAAVQRDKRDIAMIHGSIKSNVRFVARQRETFRLARLWNCCGLWTGDDDISTCLPFTRRRVVGLKKVGSGKRGRERQRQRFEIERERERLARLCLSFYYSRERLSLCWIVRSFVVLGEFFQCDEIVLSFSYSWWMCVVIMIVVLVLVLVAVVDNDDE